MSWRRDHHDARRRWVGPREKYDLIREGLIATVVVVLLVVGLAVVFGSPRMPGVSFQSWAKAAPQDFAYTTLTELAGTSETASYGPPYNTQTGQLQSLGPLSPQKWTQDWFGVLLPVDPPEDFVLGPLQRAAALDPSLTVAIGQWRAATPAQQKAWAAEALKTKPDEYQISGTTVRLQVPGDVGPLDELLGAQLALARSGTLTSQSIDAPADGYSTDTTKSLLYMEDGDYFDTIADKYLLKGEQWGVTNELGTWPGQPWLWFYAMFYNIPGWSSIGTDILAVVSVAVVVVFFLLVPYIPGVRSIPRLVPLYRLIWRPYYSRYGTSARPRGERS
jgi:hypothetical protein